MNDGRSRRLSTEHRPAQFEAELAVAATPHSVAAQRTVRALENAAAERDPFTQRVIGCALEVHKALGPGLLESAYEACLCHELRINQIKFDRQVELPVVYKKLQLDGYC